MANKHPKTDLPSETLTSESARQRWELFHRAIAHAKESTSAALDETEVHSTDTESSSPLLTIVR